MSITRLHDGSYLISMILHNVLVSRKYIGYTRREAMQRFMKEIAQ